MGYRSDVAIRVETCNGLDVNILLKRLQVQLGDDADFIRPDLVDISKEKDSLTLRFNDVKWYIHEIGFSHIDIIYQWMESLRQLAMDFSKLTAYQKLPTVKGIQFIRIGEDYTDIEEMYEGDLNSPMYVSRIIETDG